MYCVYVSPVLYCNTYPALYLDHMDRFLDRSYLKQATMHKFEFRLVPLSVGSSVEFEFTFTFTFGSRCCCCRCRRR